ncbi:hypothetical protein E3Q05_04381 [Wallemia mellicola]|nr:hypothetical protein E3Q05_04381 [Wallemia mellicola]
MSDDEDYRKAALKALEATLESQFAAPSDNHLSDEALSDDDGQDDNTEPNEEEFDSDDDIIGESTAAEVDELFSLGKNKGKAKEINDDTNKKLQNQPEVVVFGENTSSSAPRDKDSKRAQKAFMSSKIDKVQKGPSQNTNAKQRKPISELSEIDKTNLENDKELEHLLHSQLFTMPENTKNMKAGDKMRMYEGRLLEIAGKAKLGSGAANLKKKEHKNASGLIRTGLERREKEVKQNELQRAKDLGIYDKSLKHVYEDAESGKKSVKRSFGNVNADRDNKRQKGLGMGVGKFKNGMLTISKSEIDSVNSQPKRKGKK